MSGEPDGSVCLECGHHLEIPASDRSALRASARHWFVVRMSQLDIAVPVPIRIGEPSPTFFDPLMAFDRARAPDAHHRPLNMLLHDSGEDSLAACGDIRPGGGS